MSNRKAVALLSGGLDSTLAIHILKDQGIEIEAVNFQTMFGCCKDDARKVAHELGVRYTTLRVGDDYLNIIKKPKYGYGRGINPCVDCRIYMFAMAKRHMEQVGASFMISGEVLGQRPMSQKAKDFYVIERDLGLEGRILRPLSAKCLPVTLPEKEGAVDREKLFGIHGRSRQRLLELARQYGIENPPAASSGCALTSPAFAKKVRDIFNHHERFERWQFETLKVGRHFRPNPDCKIILARNRSENEYLEYLHPRGTTLLIPKGFLGPNALLIGAPATENCRAAGALMLRYAQKPLPARCEIQAESGEDVQSFEAPEPASESLVDSMRVV